MKTSFYFVLWILIYPLLDLIPGQAIQQYSFLFALVIIFFLSMAINRSMPAILHYERVSIASTILEDVFAGNVSGMNKRLTRQALVETITAVYFSLTTVALLLLAVNSGYTQWFAIFIFVFFAVGAVSRAAKLWQSRKSLMLNPTQLQCVNIAGSVYRINPQQYIQARLQQPADELLPPLPRRYRLFLGVSFVIAAASLVFGLLYIIPNIRLFATTKSVDAGTFALVFILYGLLAIYFGVRDAISIIQSYRLLRKSRA